MAQSGADVHTCKAGVDCGAAGITQTWGDGPGSLVVADWRVCAWLLHVQFRPMKAEKNATNTRVLVASRGC